MVAFPFPARGESVRCGATAPHTFVLQIQSPCLLVLRLAIASESGGGATGTRTTKALGFGDSIPPRDRCGWPLLFRVRVDPISNSRSSQHPQSSIYGEDIGCISPVALPFRASHHLYLIP